MNEWQSIETAPKDGTHILIGSQVATDPSPDESQNCLVLTDQEKQILIDHHNYEAEKAITRLGCRITERYHRDRAKAIRGGMRR